MLSLRALGRAAALRAAPRVATSSSIVRPAFRASARCSQLSVMGRSAVAAFSTSRAWADEHSQQLAVKLTQEIELEMQEAATVASSEDLVKQFFDEAPGWEVTDVEGEQDVFLQKKYDDEEVTVHFSISDFNAVMPEDEGMHDDVFGDEEEMEGQSGGANTKGSAIQSRTSGGNFRVAPNQSAAEAELDEFMEDEEEQHSAYPVSVTALIRRPNSDSKGSLRFDLLAEAGEFTIQQITHLPPSSASPAEQIREAYSGRQNMYAGPPFEQLDEELQNLLYEYLNARGVSPHLANFIPEYVDIKEQKEYLAYLDRLKAFVE